MTPKRVAVLGGGAAAIAAAYELTATPELREAHEVTVHTLGWRLGGKGASGRNRKRADRIEEHGLHIWFGFYDNAFDVMRRCYEELGRPPGSPLATLEDAFKPTSECVQYEQFRGSWVPHHFKLPTNDMTPGDAGQVGMWEMLWKAFALLEGTFARHATRTAPASARQRVGRAGARGALSIAHHGSRLRARRGHHPSSFELHAVARLTSLARNWSWRHLARDHQEDPGVRLFFMWLDLTAAVVQGILRDGLLDEGFGSINDEEFRAWLRRHGAFASTVDGSPMVRAIYDAAFCYEDGDPSRPNVAAGKAAQDLIRSLLCYRGALMYKMQAGMGDTVFAPFYEVLHREDEKLGRRRVDFEFFQRVVRLGVGSDGKSIDEIELVQQARALDGEYEPLFDVKGLPCWPSEPDWGQLADGTGPAAQEVNFEQETGPADRQRTVTLRRGVDFDVVLLAIPVGALPPICEELVAANEDFKRMLAGSSTVMTQAFQLWLTKDASALGFPYNAGSLASCYAEPLDTYCDMDQLLDRESWPQDAVGQIAYFCGVLPHAGLGSQAQADAQARANAISLLERDMQTIWPRSFNAGAFDWDLLVDGSSGVESGPQRFDSQYWRANFSGTERYALTLAGSVRDRLWPSQSGFDNLFLAGDWTRNGIDGGSVEAAVTSGMLASKAISGSPAVVRGVNGVLESDAGEPGA